MKTLLRRALLTLVAVATLAVVVPSPAVAGPWCNICDSTGDCLACCRCDGGTMRQCLDECGFPAAEGAATEASFLTAATCEAPLMSVATPATETVEAEAITETETPETQPTEVTRD